MYLQSVEVVNDITPEAFIQEYYNQNKPVVLRNLSKQWLAYEKWTWNYLKEVAGDKKIPIYNNIKSDAFTPINKADGYTTFGEYIDMISNGPAEWRIFFFNIFSHAPQLKDDFIWPSDYVKGFLKSMPSMFAGGKGSITHMHFDIDLPNIMHTQFIGRKRVLLFPKEEQYKLYRKPFEVLSLADFSNYYDAEKSKIDINKFPALAFTHGLDVILEHGDTLFMPSGYWHHMEYLESGFAMSLRAWNKTIKGKINGGWNVIGMRNIDSLMKKTMPGTWYNWKQRKIYNAANKAI
ncbi:cupin-like domain-containing protein [Deminuibacter soli]|uniref:Cupin-like domain-containing protein n=1 Tax=Deminuibacter soli TaxID=2291815 RepID=A0A3E1NEA4_9BACT|nr:cupin-like domain-containing protein [Deminuibacter soli]RFM26161.1 cupin-like domain-containing protein [Deminuibacter soli]